MSNTMVLTGLRTPKQYACVVCHQRYPDTELSHRLRNTEGVCLYCAEYEEDSGLFSDPNPPQSQSEDD